MIKSKFTLLVLFLAIILFSPKDSHAQSPIEELQQMNDSLQQLQNETPHAHVCPCYSLKKLNQLVEDYGPFIPDPGSTEVGDACTGTVFQAADERRTIDINENGNQLVVNQEDLCVDLNTSVGIPIRKILAIASHFTGVHSCTLYAIDGIDLLPQTINLTISDITNVEYQACQNIAIQWAHQGND